MFFIKRYFLLYIYIYNNFPIITYLSLFNSTEYTPSIPRNVPRQFHGMCGYYVFTYTVNSTERVQYFQRFKL